ncbi:MAG: O-antigen translocase [Sulfurospirillaceae bacterium]|nr:O-antigen translocase [Sulfurospirillaceae bacterium]MDD2826330.1 O-antigen translocase [Sulfurospirillaceae bacterium]
MTLFKVSFIVSIGFICRLVLGLVTNKLVASYAGPIGIAFMGQFQSFMQMIMSLCVGTIETGIVKHTAEYSSNQNQLNFYWSTAIKVSLVLTFISSSLILFFKDYLSIVLFGTEQYSSIFLFFSLNIFLFVFNNFFLAILNGFKEISLLVVLQIAGYLMSLCSIGLLVYWFQIYGVLLGLTLSQSLAFLVTLFFLKKKKWFKLLNFTYKFESTYFKNVFNFALMAISSAISVPTTQILIRNYIGKTSSWVDTGLWQAMWRISDIYLAIIVSIISMYFLPRLSEMQDIKLLKKELWAGYKVVIPLTILMAISIFFLRDFIIVFIFTKDFLAMEELFKFQLIGDVFKVMGVLLGYLMLAKTMTKIYIFSEIGFNLLFFVLSIVCINHFGLIGVTYAYMIKSLMYTSFLFWFFRGILFAKN